MNGPHQTPRSLAIPILTVRTDDGRTFRFSRPFQTGRERGCDVQIEDPSVSRRHVLVSYGNSRWLVRDQQSGNGVFADGGRIESIAIDSPLTIQLGATGPYIRLAVESAPAPSPSAGDELDAPTPTMIADRYFRPAVGEEPVGGRTMMIRRAFQQVHRRQRRVYLMMVAA